MANLFLDLEAGSDAADGTTFANRKKTLAGASAIALPGDTVRIMASTAPNSLGTNGTFAKGSPSITLAAAQNATIENCETAWTASANVTTTTSTTRKQGSLSTSIAPAAAFTTGLAAFKLITLADLSAYQQLSFWFQQTAGTLSGFTIKVCTDAVGAVAANTFAIPAPVVLNGWNRVTVNLGSAMSAAALSVAFYVDTDNGAQTYILDNIVACKAPGTGELSHKTLIGKLNSLGAGGDDSETWYAIRAIEGTVITLDLLNISNAGSTTNGRYWGTSETITAYSLFPSYVPTSVVTADLQWTAGGTDVSTLTISGGWNSTDMTTQTGQTWLATNYAPSAGLVFSFLSSFLAISKLHLASYPGNNSFVVSRSTITSMHIVNSIGTTISGTSLTYSGVVVCNSTGTPTLTGINHTGSLGVFVDQNGIGITIANLAGSTITLTNDSNVGSVAANPFSKLIFNGVTYGSFGEASTAAAVRTNLTTELATIVKLDTALILDGAVYQFTANALELGPAGGGGDPWSTALPGAYGAGTAGKIVGDNINATVSSRMATYTQPNGFLAATFPASIASPTNITAGTITTVTNLTNAPTAGDFTATMKAATLARVTLVDTTTTNADMRGTDSAALAATALSTANWTGTLATNLGTTNATVATNLDATVSSRGTSTLTQTQVTGGAYSIQSASAVLGDARIANLDATVSSRGTSTYAGGAVASVTGSVGSVVGLTAANLDTAVSSRMATFTQPAGFLAATFPATLASTTNITAGTITTTTNLTNSPTAGDFTATMKTSLNAATPASVVGAVGSVTSAITLPTIPTNWITADGIATDAFGALEIAAGAGSEIATAVRTELATELARIDVAISTRGTGTGTALDAAGVRSAVGLAAANLDTQLADLPTNAELATSQAAADDATLAAIAALNNLSAGQVRTELSTELGRIDVATSSRMATFTLPTNFAALGINVSGHVSRVTLVDANTDMRGTNNAMLAVSYTAPPTAVQNRVEMDANSTKLLDIVADTNELQTDWHNGGRLDLLLDAAAAGGGGNVTVGTFAAAALAQLANVATIRVSQPTLVNTTLNLIQGDDYLTVDGRQLQFSNSQGTWPNLTGATAILRFKNGTTIIPTLTSDATIVTPTGINQRIDVNLRTAVSVLLTKSSGWWELAVVLPDSSQITLLSGPSKITLQLG